MKHKPVAWLATNAVGHRYLRFKKPDETHNPVPLYALEDEPPCKTGSQCVGGKCQRCAAQEPVALSVRFPRHAPKHGEDWIIDPSFLLRIYHSIDPDAHYRFIPTMEEIETALLALEVIPSKLYTAPPQREWQGLKDEDFLGLTTQQVFAMKFAEAKLREKNL